MYANLVGTTQDVFHFVNSSNCGIRIVNGSEETIHALCEMTLNILKYFNRTVLNGMGRTCKNNTCLRGGNLP